MPTWQWVLSTVEKLHLSSGDYSAANAALDELGALADQTGAVAWKTAEVTGRGRLLAFTGKPSEAVQVLTAGLTDAAQRSGERPCINRSICTVWPMLMRHCRFRNSYQNRKGRSRLLLTMLAMANPDEGRIRIREVSNLPAETTAGHFTHVTLSLLTRLDSGKLEWHWLKAPTHPTTPWPPSDHACRNLQ